MKDEKQIKKCCKCKQYKILDQFSKNRTKKSGLNNYCRKCSKEYRILNKEKLQIYTKEYTNPNQLFKKKDTREKEKETTQKTT